MGILLKLHSQSASSQIHITTFTLLSEVTYIRPCLLTIQLIVIINEKNGDWRITCHTFLHVNKPKSFEFNYLSRDIFVYSNDINALSLPPG